MAELMQPDPRRCNFFFLYDGSKVTGEGDLTRRGICCFYPDQTPLDQQELLCGQLAGAARCVSELSSSPVRTLRLRRNKFAVRLKDDFFWALGCSADIPTLSVCELLDQLIGLFCFYHGSVRQSYQLYSQEALAARWVQYLVYLQSGSSELQHVFSSLKTIDPTNVDPLLLLKAALILQSCQRCPLVSAGCILFRGRVVSTQMSPELTMKVMVHEGETHTKSPNGVPAFGGAVSSTTVFLTAAELQYLQAAPVDKVFSSHSTPHKTKTTPPKRTRLSRTLSDTPSLESTPSRPGSCLSADGSGFSPDPESRPDPENRKLGAEAKEALEESVYHSFITMLNEGDDEEGGGGGDPNLDRGEPAETVFDFGEVEEPHDFVAGEGGAGGGAGEGGGGASLPDHEDPDPRGLSGGPEDPDEFPLIPMMLYLHRVKGLVLALLVEPHFLCDTASMEEVYHSSLASLNGLEAHLRAVAPGAPGTPGPYIFAHYDCVQSTLTSNLSGRPGGAPERPFVRATSLLHSHFCNTETLQEAIIRSAGAAVYGTRSVAQETYFQQHGGSLRNSGIPNHQDSAFSLPGKARHRLLKHGVNLL